MIMTRKRSLMSSKNCSFLYLLAAVIFSLSLSGDPGPPTGLAWLGDAEVEKTSYFAHLLGQPSCFYASRMTWYIQGLSKKIASPTPSATNVSNVAMLRWDSIIEFGVAEHDEIANLGPLTLYMIWGCYSDLWLFKHRSSENWEHNFVDNIRNFGVQTTDTKGQWSQVRAKLCMFQFQIYTLH